MAFGKLAAASVICALAAAGTCAPAAGQALDGQTGFFVILAEGPSAASLPVPTAAQRVVHYDYGFLRPEEREAPKYLLMAKQPDVVLVLSKPPGKQTGAGGRPELLLEVTEEAAAALAKVTRDHLGQHVAFVIGGDVVSTHTIKSVISDGKFRLSRCTDTACEYIYGRLTKR
jgi:hypothetical protein